MPKKNIVAVLMIFLTLIVLVSGCTQQQPLTELSIPGHGNEIYTFSNDIRESLLVKTNDPQGIKNTGLSLQHVNIVFNGSNKQDNGYFSAVLVSMINKVSLYYAYEGRIIYFDSYYFLDDKWYNSTNEMIEKPGLSDTILWLKGPATGANETSLQLVDNTIYLSGTDYKGLTLAGDKLVLLFFGIEKI